MAEVKVGAIVAELKLNSTKFAKGINKANKSLSRIKKGVSSLRSGIVGLAGAAALGLLARAVVRTMAQFEQSMANVKAVLGGTEAQMKKLTEAARDMGAVTKFSASEAAEGMEFLARAGFNTDQILKTIGATLNLAAAGSIELGEAADIASNILSGFGLEAEDLERVVDVMAKTTSSANTDIRQMGDALKFVAPVAKGFGVSVEETSAAIGILSNAGLQASLAGTGLRKIFTTLATASGKLRQKMGGLTVQNDGLTAVLKQLASTGITTTEIMVEFGERAGPAFNVLVGAVDQVEGLNGALLKAGGTAETMAKTKLDTLIGSFTELKSATQELILAFGASGFGAVLKDTVRFLRDMVQELNKVLKINRQLSENTLENRFKRQLLEIDKLTKSLKVLESRGPGRITGGGVNIEAQKKAMRERIEQLKKEAAASEKVILRNKKLEEARKAESDRLKQLLEDGKKAAEAAKKLKAQREQEELDRLGKPIKESEKPFGATIGGGIFAKQGLNIEVLEESLRIADRVGEAQKQAAIRAAQAFKDINDPLNKAKKEFDEFSKTLEQFRFANVKQERGKAFIFLPGELIDSAKALKAVEVGLIDIDAIAKSFIPTIKATKEQIEALGFFDKPVGDSLLTLEEHIKSVGKTMNKTSEEIETALERVRKSFGKGRDQFLQFFVDPLDELAKLEVGIEDVGRAMGKTGEEIEIALERARVSFGRGKEEFTKFEKAVLEGLEEIKSGFKSNLTDVLQDAFNGVDSFKEAFVNVLQVIQREIIRTLIVGQLLKAILGGVGGEIGSAATATAISLPGAAVGSAVAGLQHGGPVSPGKSFLVGEEGPELFVPQSAGNIIPNDEMGGGVSIALNVTTGIQQTVEAEFIRLLPQIQETVKAGIADARQRGGQFSRAMGV